MTQHVKLPALWLIALIVGLPILSETVYAPSLPEIAHSLSVSDSMVEYTLTIYLFAFAVGTLCWGKVSDSWGRKPVLLFGLGIYILGSLGCFLSTSIEGLMMSRFIQAFGGSTGSVLGQAICRDAFQGAALGRVYSSIGSAMAVFPAIGPVIGGVISQNFDWPMIFIFLILSGTIVLGCVMTQLFETHSSPNRQSIPIISVIKQMAMDKKVIGFGLLVAGCNGIGFSYYAEGSFYLIEMLHLSPSFYGCTFIMISIAIMVGGFVSRQLQKNYESLTVLHLGLLSVLGGSILFSVGVMLAQIFGWSDVFLVSLTIGCMMLIMGGNCIITSNALSSALTGYKNCIGTASSLFGFAYYVVVSLFTAGMGMLHTGTLWPMPLYFLAIAVFMMGVFNKMIQQKPIVTTINH